MEVPVPTFGHVNPGILPKVAAVDSSVIPPGNLLNVPPLPDHVSVLLIDVDLQQMAEVVVRAAIVLKDHAEKEMVKGIVWIGTTTVSASLNVLILLLNLVVNLFQMAVEAVVEWVPNVRLEIVMFQTRNAFCPGSRPLVVMSIPIPGLIHREDHEQEIDNCSLIFCILNS